MAGNIIPLTAASITGSGTISLDGGHLFGGYDLNADGTNAASLIVRDNNSSGQVLVDTSTVVGKTIIAPFQVPSGQIWYSLSGTGADVMLYKWNE